MSSCSGRLNWTTVVVCSGDIHLPVVIIIITDPTFDRLPHVKGCSSTAALLSVSSITGEVVCQKSGQMLVYKADISCRRQSKWDAEASRLMTSEQWLKIYGLKTAKLDMNHLLRQIAFRHSDGKHSFILTNSLCVVCTLSMLDFCKNWQNLVALIGTFSSSLIKRCLFGFDTDLALLYNVTNASSVKYIKFLSIKPSMEYVL